jgi:aspartyl-tRNA(Asn)/glutamyl-tRNA(Gln) amidotransferase subunit C
MSKITEEQINKIAKLSQIELTQQDKERLLPQINKVIEWVEKLGDVNTENVEPLTNVNNQILNLNDDVVNDGDIAQEVLKNAPQPIYGYFSVPKVIE